MRTQITSVCCLTLQDLPPTTHTLNDSNKNWDQPMAPTKTVLWHASHLKLVKESDKSLDQGVLAICVPSPLGQTKAETILPYLSQCIAFSIHKASQEPIMLPSVKSDFWSR